MKSKHNGLIGLCIGALAMGNLMAQSPGTGLVAHEWGTFTSVQGGDGVLLSWKPLETSRLPGFVYDWKRPGLKRTSTTQMLGELGKGAVQTLQRMETPVIYFYSAQQQNIDVTVRFPQGTVTEWYPQARQIGPAVAASENAQDSPATMESLIRWTGLKVSGSQGPAGAAATLPKDDSGSHYFAARDTDAAMIEGDSAGVEHEKFLFYRGVGSFGTPLKVTMKSDDAVTIVNMGEEPLKHLFVLGVNTADGNFVYVDGLAPGTEKRIPLNRNGAAMTRSALQEKISGQLAEALVKEGLYPREAAAMVNTWKDSWFAEEGVRVLYLLPRKWTDRTLPLEMKPAPTELVRVMVGRAEVLAPGLEQALSVQLNKAKTGDAAATAEARRILKGLGRFAPTAMNRAMAKVSAGPDAQTKLMALLTEAKPE